MFHMGSAYIQFLCHVVAQNMTTPLNGKSGYAYMVGTARTHFYSWVRTYTCVKYLVKGYIYLIGVLHRFQHCTGHITTGSWKGRGNQYIQFIRVCTVNCPPMASNYQLSLLRLWRESNPGLRGGRRECYHSATMAPVKRYNLHGHAKAQNPDFRL